MLIDNVCITHENFEPEEGELKAYVDFVKSHVSGVTDIHVKATDENEVDISYIAKRTPFERIRRITGYLVGTLDRWNDSKQAEERDRVKHER